MLRFASSLILLAAALSAGTALADITVYEHAGLAGRRVTFDGPIRNLGDAGFNDRVSSFRIDRGTWLACEHADFAGRCWRLDGVERDLGPTGLNDRISSLRPAGRGFEDDYGSDDDDDWGGWGGRPGRGGAVATVYQHGRFRGRSATFDGPVPDLRRLGMDDRISSLRLQGTWEICEDSHYRGRCAVVEGNVADLRGFADEISSLRPLGRGGRRDRGWDAGWGRDWDD
ncbi:MAG TPA: beta/gamma crystallin-related protein [Alphaproteobacteria bacterium]|nr:beta/gamma crystallin-related protein [Alphaproteobacteria bacterium]